MTTGEKIKYLREELLISQTDLACDVGVSKQTLYKYENNIVTNIPSDKLELIAKFLNTTPEYLMGWTDDPVDYEKLDIDIPTWWEGSVKGYIEFQKALDKDRELESSLQHYWEDEKRKSISYYEFIHKYLGYESPYSADGKNVELKLNENPCVIYRVSVEEYDDFFNFTKERIDHEFKYLLNKAEKVSTSPVVVPFTQKPQPSYLPADAAHERTGIDYTAEDRQADDDMLD